MSVEILWEGCQIIITLPASTVTITEVNYGLGAASVDLAADLLTPTPSPFLSARIRVVSQLLNVTSTLSYVLPTEELTADQLSIALPLCLPDPPVMLVLQDDLERNSTVWRRESERLFARSLTLEAARTLSTPTAHPTFSGTSQRPPRSSSGLTPPRLRPTQADSRSSITQS